MAWRVVGIENPARLSVRDNQLVILQDTEATLPIEDIDALILDGHIVVTTALIAHLSNSGTTVVICDDKHLPSSVILPYSQHSRGAKVGRLQIAMSEPLKKQIWRRIIEQKITNQADVLKLMQLNDSIVRSYVSEVKSGDSTNRESLAARMYFTQLLEDATRRKPTWHNAALNYAYAMVRSQIARHIAVRGLISSQGVFHRSELNGFNLADDLIEPYRAAVDRYVLSVIAVRHLGEDDQTLTKEDRHLLIDVLNYHVIIDGKKFTIKHAVERTVESFVECVVAKEASRLLLPQINAS